MMQEPHRQPQSWGWGSCIIRLNLLLPLGSYVKFNEDQRHKLGRYGIALLSLISPILISLTIASLLIGPRDAAHAAIDGVVLFFKGALIPWSAGADTWQAIYQGVNQQPVLRTAGVTLAFIGAINLIPLPAMPGYNVIMPLFRDPRNVRETANTFETVAILVFLGMMVSWLAALGIALVHGL